MTLSTSPQQPFLMQTDVCIGISLATLPVRWPSPPLSQRPTSMILLRALRLLLLFLGGEEGSTLLSR